MSALPTRRVALLSWPARDPASTAAKSTASMITIPECKAFLLIFSKLLQRSDYYYSRFLSISRFSIRGRGWGRIFFFHNYRMAGSPAPTREESRSSDKLPTSSKPTFRAFGFLKAMQQSGIMYDEHA